MLCARPEMTLLFSPSHTSNETHNDFYDRVQWQWDTRDFMVEDLNYGT